MAFTIDKPTGTIDTKINKDNGRTEIIWNTDILGNRFNRVFQDNEYVYSEVFQLCGNYCQFSLSKNVSKNGIEVNITCHTCPWIINGSLSISSDYHEIFNNSNLHLEDVRGSYRGCCNRMSDILDCDTNIWIIFLGVLSVRPTDVRIGFPSIGTSGRSYKVEYEITKGSKMLEKKTVGEDKKDKKDKKVRDKKNKYPTGVTTMIDMYKRIIPTDFIIEVPCSKISSDGKSLTKEFKVHYEILKSRTNYFDALKRSNMEETKMNKISLQNIDSDTLEILLNYFYTDVVSFSVNCNHYNSHEYIEDSGEKKISTIPGEKKKTGVDEEEKKNTVDELKDTRDKKDIKEITGLEDLSIDSIATNKSVKSITTNDKPDKSITNDKPEGSSGIYDTYSIKDDLLLKLYIAADMLNINELTEELLTYICSTMTLENIVGRTRFTRQYNLPDVGNVCTMYLKELPYKAKTFKLLAECMNMKEEDVEFLFYIAEDEYEGDEGDQEEEDEDI